MYLCVTACCAVLEANIRLIKPMTLIVRMDLPNRSTASHSSDAKQQRLAQQFLDTVIAFTAQGVGEIMLFFAAPVSLGTVYDHRDLPPVAVNQFENADPRRFP
ncbi:hypothetical protein NZL82_04915 [Sphingomonas sanguinis]|nr:hypothetical protein [Sphingomonas sp. LC-1]